MKVEYKSINGWVSAPQADLKVYASHQEYFTILKTVGSTLEYRLLDDNGIVIDTYVPVNNKISKEQFNKTNLIGQQAQIINTHKLKIDKELIKTSLLMVLVGLVTGIILTSMVWYYAKY